PFRRFPNQAGEETQNKEWEKSRAAFGLNVREFRSSKPAATSGDENPMMKSKKRFVVLLMAMLTLMVAGAAGFAQRHFMLGAARPEVKMQLSGVVERDSALVPLDKTTVVNPGEILDWIITSENTGSSAALEYKAVGHI